MKTPERMALLSYCVSLASLVLVVVAAYSISLQQLKTTEWVERGKRVLESLDHIEELVLDAESAERAYRYTGDAGFGSRFQALVGTLRTELEKTKALVNDTPVSKELVRQLQERVERWVDHLAAGLEAPKKEAPGSSAAAESVEDINAAVNQVRKHENGLFDELIKARNAAARAGWTLLILAVIVGTVLLTWTYRQTRVANAARQAAEEHARHLALHDALTGLSNRRMLDEHLSKRIAAADRHGHMVALMFLDLDGFKAVNDRWGHHHGDDVLKEVAQRLRHNVRKEDLIVRLGGDEFAIAFSHLHSMEEVCFLAEKLVGLLSRPYAVGESTANVSASIGLAVFPENGTSVESLLKAADQAVYEAKSAGKKQFRVASRSAVPVNG